jgi:5-methylcytosine-specific restriction protein A
MRNPDWNREELILALNLYFKMDYGQMHGRNPDVIQLSKDLRNLYIHSNIPDKEKFRSVNSVALKLANLKKSDQNFKGKGMRDGGKLEKEIWNEFHRHRDTLKNEADLIRQLYLKPKSENKSVTAEPKVNYKSDFLYLFHKNRETDPLVNKVKKEMVLTNSKSLKCEVCGFDSVAFYGELGNDLMEIHYKKESKNEPGLESSSMEDFIIVCSNCHKALDKNFGLLNADDLKKIIRKR